MYALGTGPLKVQAGNRINLTWFKTEDFWEMTIYRGVIRVEGSHKGKWYTRDQQEWGLITTSGPEEAQSGASVTGGQGEPALEEGASESQSPRMLPLPKSDAEAEWEQVGNSLTSSSSHLLITIGHTQREARCPRERLRQADSTVLKGVPPRTQNSALKGREWVGGTGVHGIQRVTSTGTNSLSYLERGITQSIVFHHSC